ncbi:hypothetical protein BS639_24045 [Rouxiella silvae]|uniref:Tyr recombinase domain-containing protein n=3 Tax=Rouxiella TaxID=1565532 RepID=A0ABX3TU72_9GAMM|nr:hypothetical protein BS639_24045 [Rouxiella silvae]
MRDLPRELFQNSHSAISTISHPASTDMALALRMRNLAAAMPGHIKYLLPVEVSALIACARHLKQRMFLDTLWNTGARLNEALALAPKDFRLQPDAEPAARRGRLEILSHYQANVTLITLKARSLSSGRGKGRVPTAEREKITQATRIVPLLDPDYARRMDEYLQTFHRGEKHTQLWPVSSRQTAANWINAAVEEAARAGVRFSVPVTCHTLRHSYAMHLKMNGLDDKTLMALMGHKYAKSLQVYTKVFALDVLSGSTLRFTQSGEDAVAELRAMQRS